MSERVQRVAGIDIGGTKIDVLVQDLTGLYAYQWETARFNSVEDVLCAVADKHGTIDKAAIAAAGRLDHTGTLHLTNVDWPAYKPNQQTPAHICAYAIVVNDVECAAGAMPALANNELRGLNGVVAPTDELIAVAVSTGENSAYRDANGKVHPAETGHTGWQPWLDAEGGDLAYDLLRYMQEQRPRDLITVEDVISGNRGFDTLYDFVSKIVPPGIELEAWTNELRSQGEGIGPAVTDAAIRGDQCAKTCMNLWGPVFGQYLRERVLSHMPKGGSLYLYGGVAQAEGVLDYVVSKTPFWQHFFGGGANMRSLMEIVSVRVVVKQPDAHPLTVRGALELAKAA